MIRYQGDEKIKNFIWDLITPGEPGSEVQKIARNHSGLHNLVPRGRNAKGNGQHDIFTYKNKYSVTCIGRKGGGKGAKEVIQPPREKLIAGQNITDPNHWSKEEKYSTDEYLEVNYKKHLARHANK